MQNKEIFGLTNKENQRIYGTVQSLIKKGFNDSNIYQFLNGKRKSINGYTYLIDFEVLNERYDTLVFNSRDLLVPDYYLSQFIDSKEQAQLENKEHIVHTIMGVEWIIKKKSIGFYNVSFYYNNLFLFHMAADKVQIKVLSNAFYLCTYEEILAQLNYLCLAMFKFTLEQCFIVSKLDYAIDIRFKDLDLIKIIQNEKKKYKSFANRGQFKTFEQEETGKSVTLTCGIVQYIIYDKVLEVFQNDDKKLIYKDLFNIDFNNDFCLDDYNQSKENIVRFEYRLKNQNDYLVSKSVSPTCVFKDTMYVKKIIYGLLDKHTAYNIPEEDILKEILNSDTEIKEVKFDEEQNLEFQMYHALRVLYTYMAGVQSRKMILDGNNSLEKGFEETIDFVRSNMENYNYYEKVANKIMEIYNRKYK